MSYPKKLTLTVILCILLLALALSVSKYDYGIKSFTWILSGDQVSGHLSTIDTKSNAVFWKRVSWLTWLSEYFATEKQKGAAKADAELWQKCLDKGTKLALAMWADSQVATSILGYNSQSSFLDPKELKRNGWDERPYLENREDAEKEMASDPFKNVNSKFSIDPRNNIWVAWQQILGGTFDGKTFEVC